MDDLGDRIHKVVLDEPTSVDFLNKSGKKVISFKVGLLSVREVVKISQIAYKIRIPEKQDISAVHALVSKESGRVIQIISIMLKSRSRLPLPVIRYIVRRYSTAEDLQKLVMLAYDSMNVKSFLSSIILLTGMSLIKPEEIKASQEKEAKNQNSTQ